MEIYKEYKNEMENVQEHIKYLKFDKKHCWHRNLIALYLSLIEYSDSLICFVEIERSIAIPVVFRSLLEAYVDFKNLSEDKTYGYHMEASNVAQSFKFLKEADKNNNEYLALIASHQSFLITEIERLNTKCKELKKNGYLNDKNYPVLKICEKFKMAGMTQEYNSIYKHLCTHSHNNIDSFAARFFVINE